ncbi:MAG: M1 family peptidase, partial [Flavobacteriia bacterium]|nr:M1 family peptidase [Flavobacteriia bacterium]
TFVDDSTEIQRIPVEIWRQYEDKVSKVFIFDKEVKEIRLDPFLETADVDLNNNTWPEVVQPSRYQLFKQNPSKDNPMQRQKKVDAIKN